MTKNIEYREMPVETETLVGDRVTYRIIAGRIGNEDTEVLKIERPIEFAPIGTLGEATIQLGHYGDEDYTEKRATGFINGEGNFTYFVTERPGYQVAVVGRFWDFREIAE